MTGYEKLNYDRNKRSLWEVHTGNVKACYNIFKHAKLKI